MAEKSGKHPSEVQKIMENDPRTAEEWNQAGLNALTSRGSKPGTALHCFSQALAMEPENARFMSNQGVALKNAGRMEEAEEAFQGVIKIDPQNADALHGLGSMALARQDVAAAVECFEKALKIRPEFPQALSSLGMILSRRGDFGRAVELLRKAIQIKPEYGPAHRNLGDLLLANEQLDEALQTYGRAMKLEPKNGELFRLRAQAFLMKNDLRKAEQACQRSIKLLPGLMSSHMTMARIQERMKKFREAEKSYRTALALNPKSAQTHCALGKILFLNKDMFGEAERHLGRAIELRPDFAEAKLALANAYVTKGRMNEAEILLEEIVSTEPENVDAYRQLAHIRKAGGKEYDHLSKMEALISDPKVNVIKKAELHYGLAEAFDHMGEYDKAFSHIFDANESDGSRNIYDMETPQRQYKEIKEVFTHEFFEERRGYGLATEVPVFIVGMPRSGTTLTEQIIASHPESFGAGELNEIGKMKTHIRRIVGPSKKFPHSVADLRQRAVTGLAQGHLNYLRRLDAKALRVTDKMPFNLFSLGLIALLYPNCKIFWCRRNLLDNCLSCYFLRFVDHMAYATDLYNLGRFYRIHEQIMEYWHEALPITIHEVKYDDMVADQEGMTRRLIENCGLEWDDKCLAFYKDERAVKTPSNWQVRQPIYKSSSGRWRNYEKHLKPLIEGLGLTEAELKEL